MAKRVQLVAPCGCWRSFGAFQAIATSSVKLARFVSPDELAMEPQVAEAVLKFGEDLREAAASAVEWGRSKGICRDAV